MTKILEVVGLSKQFGGLRAVQDVSFSLSKGEIAALIGPNGAGKSTTFSMVAGSVRASSGDILFKGEPITKLKPSQIVQRGLSRTFQSTVIWVSSTVWENLCRGCFVKYAHAFNNRGLAPASNDGIAADRLLNGILDLLSLQPYRDKIAGTLPYGYQRRLGIAIALASEPELLLLDEPAAGLNDKEAERLADDIRTIARERDVTVLLVEHHMKMVMGLCGKILVLDHGKMIATGTPKEIARVPAVIEAYLGQEELEESA